jgi:hypothetical protein
MLGGSSLRFNFVLKTRRGAPAQEVSAQVGARRIIRDGQLIAGVHDKHITTSDNYQSAVIIRNVAFGQNGNQPVKVAIFHST